jgi:hypothetical protein
VFAEGVDTGGELAGVLAEHSQRHGGLTGEIGVGTPFSGGNVDERLPDGVELLHGGAEVYTLYVEQGGFFEDLQVHIGGEHKHTSSRGKVELFTPRSDIIIVLICADVKKKFVSVNKAYCHNVGS